MTFGEFNAVKFKHNKRFYDNTFEEILKGIIECYYKMIGDNIKFFNKENSIRDEILKHLKNNDIRERLNLKDYLFDREVPEDSSIGRTDLKIQTKKTFFDTSAYYIIECKRLNNNKTDGTTGLNAKYIEKGILRFTSSYYSTHYKTNGMIGFVVAKMDIEKNKDSINNLLNSKFTETNTVQDLQFRKITNDFKFSYCSIHKINENNAVLYHIMLDFSDNVIKK